LHLTKTPDWRKSQNYGREPGILNRQILPENDRKFVNFAVNQRNKNGACF